MAAIADKTVRQLAAKSAAEGRRIEGSHPQAEGLRVRVNAATDSVSWVWYGPRDAQGKRDLHVLGSYPAMSAKEAAERLAALRLDNKRREAGLPAASAAQDVSRTTLRQLVARFAWEVLRRKRRTSRRTVRVLRLHVLGPLGDGTEVRMLRTEDIERLVARLEGQGKRNQAQKVLALVKQMLAFAVRRHIINSSPAAALTLRDFDVETTPRSRRLTPDELGKLWAAFQAPPDAALDQARDETSRLGLAVLLATGRRSGELRQATWDHFDLDAAVWKVPPEVRKLTKRALARAQSDIVHLAPQVVNVLRRLHALATNGWVLPTPPGLSSRRGHLGDNSLAREFQKVVERLGFRAHATPHDFRRTFRTTAEEQRWASPLALELCLGHTLGDRIMRTYNVATYDEERAHALDRWASYLDAQAGIGEVKVANLDAARARRRS